MWLVFALISTILVSSSSILEKKVLLKEHALQFSARLAFYCFLITIPFYFIFPYNVSQQLTPLAIIAATAILGGSAFFLIMKSVRHMEISEISSFIALSPIITALFGFLFLGEILTFVQVLGISIVVMGIYVLELKNTTKIVIPFRNIASNTYIHFVFYALVLYGVTDVLGKFVLSKYDFQPGVYLFYYQLFLVVFYFVCLLFQNRTTYKAHFKTSRQDTILIVFIAILTLGYRYFHLATIKIVSIGIALAIHRSSTLITTIIGGTLFKESGLVRKSIATLAVIVGIILIVI